MNDKLTTDNFDYELPNELIAHQPVPSRDQSRLLVMSRVSDQLQDGVFTELVNWLHPGDLMILNDTKVFPARLFARKQSGGKIEILAERIESNQHVKAQIKSNRTPAIGSMLLLNEEVQIEVMAREDEFFILNFLTSRPALEIFQEYGHVPLPPYIERCDEAGDLTRYQTVYAQHAGAVAAPTAGLHFTEDLLDKCQAMGVNIAKVTLHVGAGTFKPIKVNDVTEHKMHSEYAHVSEQVCEQIRQTKQAGHRVIAIGTTCVRALESAAVTGKIRPFMGDTDIFIYPGYSFKVVDALLTNFHLPKSTLLMLISALAGRDRVMQAYQHAIQQQYRFFSYGDAMFISDQVLD